jgi:GNAT superfamily N-acetyltransferase
MGALRPSDAGTAEVKRMRVHPDFQRRGFGSAVLRALEERARELGFTSLRLDTPEFNVGARRFYARHGYAECGVTEMPWFAIVLFEKHLPTDDAPAT